MRLPTPEWRAKVRASLKKRGVTLRRLAQKAEISESLLEKWLTEKPWGTEPSLLQKLGINQLLSAMWERSVPARSGYNKWWKNTDWSKTDEEIAIIVGISPQAVAQRRRGCMIQPIQKRSKWDGVDWSKSNRQIANERGVSLSCCSEYRRRAHLQLAQTTV